MLTKVRFSGFVILPVMEKRGAQTRVFRDMFFDFFSGSPGCVDLSVELMQMQRDHQHSKHS